MKKINLLLLLLFGLLISLSAQNGKNTYQLKEVGISWGQGALTSGLDVTIKFDNQRHPISLVGNADRWLINYGAKWGNFTPELSFGAFKNIPWTGPKLIYSFKKITLFSWTGAGFSNDKTMQKIGREFNFFFSYNSVSLSAGSFDLTAAFQYFANENINYLPAIKKRFVIGPGILGFEAIYNSRKNIPMFVMGYKMKF